MSTPVDSLPPAPDLNHPIVVEIDRLMKILPEELIGEYLKFDKVCDILLDLRQMVNEN